MPRPLHFCWTFSLGLCLLIQLPPPHAANAGLRILLKKDSAVFRRNSIQLNCSEPACHGHFEGIYCGGPLIWASWQFGMQKECPGNRLRFPPEIVLQNFKEAFDGDQLRRDKFRHFCEENFDNRPYLETARIPEWRQVPALIERIREPKMKFFAKQIHKIWPLLSKRFVDDVQQNPSRYPLVSVHNRFIVPGSLFQVYFYWDSFWIIRGLLLSDLLDTARGMIDNFGTLIQQIGHVPNSANVQFSRRSQPPLFTQMLWDYWQASKDSQFVRKMLGLAEKELDWWRRERSIQHRNSVGKQYTLFLYKTETNCPRPEGFLLDFQFGIDSGREDLEFFWSSTTSAAESGMDFSSRWFSTDDPDEEMAYTRKGIRTNDVLPVDLNVYMALNYRAMAKMYSQLGGGNPQKAKHFAGLANALVVAIDDIFRVPSEEASQRNGSGTVGVWFDFDLSRRQLRRRFYPSDIFPLLLLSADGNESSIDTHREANCAQVMDFLRASGALRFKGRSIPYVGHTLVFLPGGLPSSMERNSVELWDFPIGWPPLNHFAVLALLRCRTAEATEAARQIAEGLLTTASNGLQQARRGLPAQIWEKYDARFEDGRPGFGIDYQEQIGFGWTNGVLLDFIRLFHTNQKDDHQNYWLPI